MSRTYISVRTSRDSRNEATHASPTSCHIRGWDVGVMVQYAPDGDRDAWRVYATGGSNNPAQTTYLATVTQDGVIYAESNDLEAKLPESLQYRLDEDIPRKTDT